MENETNNDSFDKNDLINILKLGEIDIDVKEDYFNFYLNLQSAMNKIFPHKRTVTSKILLILYCLQKISSKLPKLVMNQLKLNVNNIIDVKRDIFNHIKETLENPQNSDFNLSETHFLKVKEEKKDVLENCVIKCDEILSDLDNCDNSDLEFVTNSENSHDINSTAKNSQKKLLEHELLLENNQYYCKLCHKSFNTRIKLLSHRVKHKPQELGEFKCNICEQTLITKRALIKHKSAQHKQLYKCEICNIEMKNNRKFEIHLKVGVQLNVSLKLLINLLYLSASILIS